MSSDHLRLARTEFSEAAQAARKHRVEMAALPMVHLTAGSGRELLEHDQCIDVPELLVVECLGEPAHN